MIHSTRIHLTALIKSTKWPNNWKKEKIKREENISDFMEKKDIYHYKLVTKELTSLFVTSLSDS